MTTLLLFFLSSLFITGVLIQLSSLSKYAAFVGTEGEIIAFIERMESRGRNQGCQWTNEPMPVAYLPVVAYRVGETVYELTVNNQAWKQPDFSRRLPVVYNPYQPGESFVKEGTPFLGLVLIGLSLLGLILLFVL